jgi:hypothetical protein
MNTISDAVTKSSRKRLFAAENQVDAAIFLRLQLLVCGHAVLCLVAVGVAVLG